MIKSNAPWNRNESATMGAAFVATGSASGPDGKPGLQPRSFFRNGLSLVRIDEPIKPGAWEASIA